MGIFEIFFVVSPNKLLKKVEMSVIWDDMTLIWRHYDAVL